MDGVLPSVQDDVCSLVERLEMEGFLRKGLDHITAGGRTPAAAHKFSTAYDIIHNHISLEALQETPVDADGNVWYPHSLPTDLTCLSEYQLIALETLVKSNASYISRDTQNRTLICTQYGCFPDVSFALEGYPRGDPRRRPNTDRWPVSKHVYGLAVDVGDNWATTEYWKPEVDAIANEFDLNRPYFPGNIVEPIDEYWHFERSGVDGGGGSGGNRR